MTRIGLTAGAALKRSSPASTFDLGAWNGSALTEYVRNVTSGVASSTQTNGSV